MKPIASFTINHLTLLPGVYVSRKDAVGERPELVERSLAELVHYFFRVGVSAVLRKVVDNIHQKRIGATVIAVVLRHDVFKSVCLEVDLFHDAYYTKSAAGSGHERKNLVLAHVSYLLRGEFAALEEKKRGDRHDSELRREVGALVHVHLADL